MAEEKTEDKGGDKSDKPVERPEKQVVTQHSAVIAGGEVDYTVTVETVNLKDDKGEDRASIFAVSYVRDAADTQRPVTFCFNGGPGSSAVWLHFGAFGPKRVDIPDLVTVKPPPHTLIDNPEGLFDLSDLVFIDPVGTGFSRPAGEKKIDAYTGVKEDIESVGEFIWRWLSRNGRWNSPKFIAGESYGTTRCGGLANWLQEKGIALNGVVLVSLATNFQTFVAETGNDLPHVLYLPTFALVASYHGVIPQVDLDEVKRFAVEDYAPALMKGDRLPDEDRDALAEQLAAYTGLPAGQIARRQLRIPYLWFARNLLELPDHTVGRMDGRYIGPDSDPYAQSMARDPAIDAVWPSFTAVANDTLRRVYGFESDELYQVLNMDVNKAWRWSQEGRLGFINTNEDLRAAIVANPHLRVIVCNGVYDLATPMFAASYSIDTLGLPQDRRGNVSVEFYEAGHMMYFHPPSLAKLRADLESFYAKALG
ncbi:MAG TPA: peptidase S10 [Myxococcota bacterium]|nr:peptidase S10 [Myxococcota bacterium]